MREQLQEIASQLRGSWRYRWQALGVAWLICLFGWPTVYLLPDSYESSAKVYVDTTSALEPLLDKMTVNTDVLTRVEVVTAAILGREQLEMVARQAGMHLRADSSKDMDLLVLGMRDRIDILNEDRSDPNLFTIYYMDHDPQVAQDVVATLLNTFVEDSLGEDRDDAEQAQVFLREQIRKLGEELSVAEKTLADFKRENVGRVPGQGLDYFGRLQAEMEALETTKSQIRLAQRRQQALRQQLSGESPTIDSSGGLQSDLDRRIDEHESRLEELQLRFTDLHPDVVAVKQTLVQLKTQKQAELDARTRNDGSGIASDNPVFQNIQIELTNVSVELATLREQESSQRRKITELQQLVDVLPQVEAELARLTRDYDVRQSQYQSLLQRLAVAELSESAEQSEDVKFRVIDPPTYPDDPSAPDRPLLVALVLLVGLGSGAGLAFLRDQINPVFSSARMLEKTIGLPVLGSVQVMHTVERQRWRVAQITTFSGGLIALIALFVVVLFMHEEGSQLLKILV